VNPETNTIAMPTPLNKGANFQHVIGDDLISSFLSWDMPSDSEMSGVSLISVTEMEVVLS
jgi:hypothetical protein